MQNVLLMRDEPLHDVAKEKLKISLSYSLVSSLKL